MISAATTPPQSDPERCVPVFNAVFPDRLRLARNFDPVRLQADLARLEHSDWVRHFVPQNYDGDWSVLPLRAPIGATHPILRIAAPSDARGWVETELLAACPYFGSVLATFRCSLQAARLMRLGPGSRIKPHADHDLAAEYGVARLHVPITTNPQVDFRVNDRRVDMAPGSLWYLRLSDPHSVENAGTTARVHLVIDAEVNPWLERLLAAARDVAAPDQRAGASK